MTLSPDATWFADLPLATFGAVKRQTIVLGHPTDITRTIQRISENDRHHPCIIIQKSGELGEQLRQLIIDPKTGEATITDGPSQAIYADQPITLVVDLTRLNAKQASSLNDIFDQTAPTYAGLPLGKNVNLIAIITSQMVVSPELPSDFVSRLPLCYRMPAQSRPLHPLIPISKAPQFPIIALYHDPENAIEEIVGGPSITSDGQLTAIPGPLIRAIREGLPGLIITDPPINDSKFECWITRVIAGKQIPFNGETIPLPNDFQIVLATGIPETERHQIGRCTVIRWEGEPSDLTLTSDTVQFLFPSVQVTSDDTIRLTSGLSGKRIKISGPLSPRQWIKLLHHTTDAHTIMISNATPTQFLTKIGITVHPLSDQPTQSVTQSSTVHYRPGVHWITSPDLDFTVTSMVDLPAAHRIVDLSKSMDTEAPFQIQSVLSFISRRLRSTDTPLLHDIEGGVPLLIRGCESHPQLTQYLQTLFETPPYLLINGNFRPFPNANITFLSTGAPPFTGNLRTLHHQFTLTDLFSMAHLPADAKHILENIQNATGISLQWRLLTRIQTTADSHGWQVATLRHLGPRLKSNSAHYAYTKCLLSAASTTANALPTLNQ